jgi:hypothetical protein
MVRFANISFVQQIVPCMRQPRLQLLRMAKLIKLAENVVFRDRWFYAAHPHVLLNAAGDLLVVFNRSFRRREIMHPPHDPEYRNVLTRSSDAGLTWSTPEVVPGYDCSGTECAGLTLLPSGRILMSQWRNTWFPLGLARSGAAGAANFPGEFVTELIENAELETGQKIAADPESFAPWARGGGISTISISDDNGQSFARSVTLDTSPFRGGYGLRACVRCGNGTLLLPLNDVPAFKTIFVLRSHDDGASWEKAALVGEAENHLFTEAAIACAANGTLVCMMRDDVTRIMHVCISEDEGESWSEPSPTGIDGYPPHLLSLPDGNLLCTYGRRLPEFSIRAVLSQDNGLTWQHKDPFILRDHLPNRDLGYPTSTLMPDGSLMTAYYCQDSAGITGIECLQWRIEV